MSGVKREFYPMDDNSEKQLPLNKLKQRVKICGRVQKLLKVVAGFINSEENVILKEFKNNLKCEIGNDIDLKLHTL